MTPIAIVDMDLRSPWDPAGHPMLRDRLQRIDIYQLPTTDLARYPGLIVSGTMVDQELLYRHRNLIRDYLDSGGVVVFGGHLHRPWLPGAGLFVPKPIHSFRDYEVRIVADHTVFAGVDPHDLTYRRGVAGFFARGHHPPPDGAEVLVTFTTGEPVTYVDRVTTGGTIFLQSSGDLLGYALSDSTAARLAPQLLAWIWTARRPSERT